MAPDETALALLVLFCTAALKVYGCVCYVGQEPVGATGKRYGWSLAEQRPCECTEFRLGGVNIKPQIKPFEVKIGVFNRVSINEQGHIIQSPDCRQDQSGTTFEGTSLCTRLRLQDTVEFQRPMTSPMRLQFTVSIVGDYGPYVYFSSNGPGFDEALYRVTLYPEYAGIYIREPSVPAWITVQSKSGIKYIGVPVMITYNNGRFEVAVQGLQNSTLTYDVTAPAQLSWFVSFGTPNEAEFVFTEPCINDFNPHFKVP